MSNPNIDSYGNKRWYNSEGKLHRLDGPAYEGSSGTKIWYVNGQYHRLNGPACEWASGCEEWYVDGKRHRLDGPATEWDTSLHVKTKPPSEWWIDNVQVTEKEYPEAVLMYKCRMVLES